MIATYATTDYSQEAEAHRFLTRVAAGLTETVVGYGDTTIADVKTLSLDGERQAVLEVDDPDGETVTFTSRWIVEAGGNNPETHVHNAVDAIIASILENEA